MRRFSSGRPAEQDEPSVIYVDRGLVARYTPGDWALEGLQILREERERRYLYL